MALSGPEWGILHLVLSSQESHSNVGVLQKQTESSWRRLQLLS